MELIELKSGESVSITTGKITITASTNLVGDLVMTMNDKMTHVSTHNQAGKTDVRFWKTASR